MPTATPSKPAAPAWSPHQDYLVTAHDQGYKGETAHQSFNNGVAQILALPADVEDEAIRQRMIDLYWFVSSPNYAIEEASFLRAKQRDVVVEDAHGD